MNDDASRAKQYRAKAEELRVLANYMSTEQTRKTCLELADDYLKMAARLERYIGQKPDSAPP